MTQADFDRLTRRHPTELEVRELLNCAADTPLDLPEWANAGLLAIFEQTTSLIQRFGVPPGNAVFASLKVAFELGRDSERREWANDTVPVVEGGG